MPSRVTIACEQAVYGSFPFWDKGYAVLCASAGCREEWVAEFARLCRSLGQPPSDAAPVVDRLLFARKIAGGPWVVALGSVQGFDDRGRPGAWAFHGIFLRNRDYRAAGASPFPFRKHLRTSFASETRLTGDRIEVEPEADGEQEFDSAKVRWIARGRMLRRLSDAQTEESAREFWRSLPISVRNKRSLATWAFRPDADFHWASVTAPKCFDELDGDSRNVWRFAPEELYGEPKPTGKYRVAYLKIGIIALVAVVLLTIFVRLRHGRTGLEQSDRPSVDRGSEKDGLEASKPPERMAYVAADLPPDVVRRIDERLADWADRLDPAEDADGRSIAARAERICSALRYRGPIISLEFESNAKHPATYAVAAAYSDIVRTHAAYRDWPDVDEHTDPVPTLWVMATLAWCVRSSELRAEASRVRTAEDVEIWFARFREHVIPDSIPDLLPSTGLEQNHPELVDYRLHLSRVLRMR